MDMTVHVYKHRDQPDEYQLEVSTEPNAKVQEIPKLTIQEHTD